MFLPLTHRQKANHENTISAAMNGVSIHPHTMRNKDLSHIQHVFLLLFVRALEKSFRLLFFFMHQLYLHPQPQVQPVLMTLCAPLYPSTQNQSCPRQYRAQHHHPRAPQQKEKSRHKQETPLARDGPHENNPARSSPLAHPHPCTPTPPKTH